MIVPDDPRTQMTFTPLRSDSSGWIPATDADSCRPRDCLRARRPRLAPARLLVALALGGGCEEPNEEAEPVCENFIDSARGCLEYRLAQGMDTQLWGCTFSCDYSGRCIDVPADPLAESWGEILRRACNDYQFEKENACEA